MTLLFKDIVLSAVINYGSYGKIVNIPKNSDYNLFRVEGTNTLECLQIMSYPVYHSIGHHFAGVLVYKDMFSSVDLSMVFNDMEEYTIVNKVERSSVDIQVERIESRTSQKSIKRAIHVLDSVSSSLTCGEAIIKEVCNLLNKIETTVSDTITGLTEMADVHGTRVHVISDAPGDYTFVRLSYKSRSVLIKFPNYLVNGKIESTYSPVVGSMSAQGTQISEVSFTGDIEIDVYNAFISVLNKMGEDSELVDAFSTSIHRLMRFKSQDSLEDDVEDIVFDEPVDGRLHSALFHKTPNNLSQASSSDEPMVIIKQFEEHFDKVCKDNRFGLLPGYCSVIGREQYRLGIYYNPTMSHYRSELLLNLTQTNKGLLITYTEDNFPAVQMLIEDVTTDSESKAVACNLDRNTFDVFNVAGPMTLVLLVRIITEVMVAHEGSALRELLGNLKTGLPN